MNLTERLDDVSAFPVGIDTRGIQSIELERATAKHGKN
jgi:trehalose-6-phosphate synthase